MVSRLKKSCIVAPAKARWNSVRRFMEVMATMVLVTVVPMLAPMMMGTALVTVSAPPATMPTTIEVVLDELWISEVASRPIIRPITGLVVVAISCSLNPLPSILKAAPNRAIAHRKM